MELLPSQFGPPSSIRRLAGRPSRYTYYIEGQLYEPYHLEDALFGRRGSFLAGGFRLPQQLILPSYGRPASLEVHAFLYAARRMRGPVVHYMPIVIMMYVNFEVTGVPSTGGGTAVYMIWSESLKHWDTCLLYTSPSPRDRQKSRMPSSA